MKWNVTISKKAAKQIQKLPKFVKTAFFFLMRDLETHGPATSGIWKHYGKLKGMGKVDKRHCHVIKGKPTYVCCWEVTNKQWRIIEVYYVGTHERAPY